MSKDQQLSLLQDSEPFCLREANNRIQHIPTFFKVFREKHFGHSELVSPFHFRAKESKAEVACERRRWGQGLGVCFQAQVFMPPSCFVRMMLLSQVLPRPTLLRTSRKPLSWTHISRHIVLDGAEYLFPCFPPGPAAGSSRTPKGTRLSTT